MSPTPLPDVAVQMVGLAILAGLAFGILDIHRQIETQEGRRPMWAVLSDWYAAIKGYRTIFLHALSGIWALLEAFNFTAFVDDPKRLALILFAVNVVGVILRLVTNGPVPAVQSATDKGSG